jgi:hypothetical protein
MSADNQLKALLGGVQVHTVSHRGWTPEEQADRAVDKIIHVGRQSHPAIIDQALAFKESIRFVLVDQLKQSRVYERDRLAALLDAQGFDGAAHLVRSN